MISKASIVVKQEGKENGNVVSGACILSIQNTNDIIVYTLGNYITYINIYSSVRNKERGGGRGCERWRSKDSIVVKNEVIENENFVCMHHAYYNI